MIQRFAIIAALVAIIAAHAAAGPNENLMNAVQSGNLRAAEAAVRAGANINIQDKNGQTPLHIAVANMNENMAGFLLSNGARTDIKDNNGSTPEDLVEKALVLDEMGGMEGGGRGGREGGRRGGKRLKALFEKQRSMGDKKADNPSQLVYYAMNGNEAEVKRLLDANIDPGAADESGMTALHHAAKRGYEGIARLLVGKKAPVMALDRQKATPLHYAAVSDGPEMAGMLMAAGADVTAKDAAGMTPLHRAAEGNNVAVVELLLKKGARINDKSVSGFTPLHCAATNLAEGAVSYMLDNGADVAAEDNQGLTALWYASRYMRTAKKQQTAWAIMTELGFYHHGNKGPGKGLGSAKEYPVRPGDPPVIVAAKKNDLEGMKRLIKQKANLNVRDSLKRTALHYAAAKDEWDMVKLLCDSGATPDPFDVNRNAPIDLANENGWMNVVHTLYFGYGARGKDKLTRTTVIENGKSRTWGGEKADDADASKKDGDKKKSAVEYARAGEFGEMMKLINGGADVNRADDDGMAPLHYVAQSGDVKMLQYLINRGADINLRNKAGKTPADLASEAGNREATALLRKEVKK